MLDPGLGTEAVIDQRPTVLRRGRHVAIDNGLRVEDLGKGRKQHETSISKPVHTASGEIYLMSVR